MRHPTTDEWVQAGFGYDLFVTRTRETYFAFCLYRVELVINTGGPSIKRPCDGEQKGLQIVQDRAFEDFILQDFVERVQVDYAVGTLARGLLRAYSVIGKPQDAIHIATALLHNVDELHTFDRENLLGLSSKINRKDGKSLRICHPPQPPAPPKPEVRQGGLFDQLGKKPDEQPNNTSQGRGQK
jgi:PIN domain-containing protein